MHGFWPFAILVKVPTTDSNGGDSSPQERRLYFLFCSASCPDPNSVAEFVEEYCDKQRPPDAIYLIAPESERNAIETVLDSEEFKNRARGATRFSDPPVTDCLIFNCDGKVVNRAGRDPECLDMEAVKRLALTFLVNDSSACVTAPQSHHFVVPSESHAQTFFRVANAMADGAAIDFIAFCCLPFFAGRNVKNVYCDTGAISPVVYAINALRTRMGQSSFACPSSFKSYSGAKQFKFRDMDNSLIMISLSTSGGLSPFIREHHNGISDRDMLTLFILHKPTSSTQFVCDLRKDLSKNPEGFDPIQTYTEEDCPLCAQGSTRILISTEQFLPGHGHNEQVLIRAQHSPSWLRPLISQFVGTGLIRAHYRLQDNAQAVSHATAEVFFDLQRLFADEELMGIGSYRELFWRKVDQAIPAVLDRIICLDSPASVEMARRIAARAKDTLHREIPVFGYSAAIEKLKELKTAKSRATLVVAAAAASGRSLLSVSQLLRHIQNTGGITYLVGLARFSSPESLKEVESNLTRGERPQDHGFFVVERVFLPLGGSQSETTWDLEKRLLDELIAECEASKTRDALERRRDLIRRAAGDQVRGLSDELFWANADKPLRLRQGFVFFPSLKSKTKPSQADVYFTIASVLHGRRSVRGEDDSLFQQEHVRKILSPRCFDRFNDGVIQASFLRAATLPELDYSIDESISKEMWQVLDFIFRAVAVDAGEASREFLLALALERLRLRIVDMEELKKHHGDNTQDPIDKLLWKKIGTMLEKRESRKHRLSIADTSVQQIDRNATSNAPETRAASLAHSLPQKIAILGWGSLLSEPNADFDSHHDDWQPDGPTLKIEYSRISKKRHPGALTLVIDNVNGAPNQVRWCLSKRASAAATARDLQDREEATEKDIKILDVSDNSLADESVERIIANWAKGRGITSVVWTALLSNFESEKTTRFTCEAALAHMKGLNNESKKYAIEYVQNTPAFLETPFRTAFISDPELGSYHSDNPA